MIKIIRALQSLRRTPPARKNMRECWTDCKDAIQALDEPTEKVP
nr:hypothetical protein [Sphingomonas populi]